MSRRKLGTTSQWKVRRQMLEHNAWKLKPRRTESICDNGRNTTAFILCLNCIWNQRSESGAPQLSIGRPFPFSTHARL
ncbi:uncharacterized protein EAF01_008816 [Botrytis porri]|uniref:uncharacterized protein n=1 Tax=Botrytis porri TaxID=87229 RepID=UPI0019028203|nr:uncharacterized protein EAF01_008816 [Botrytis porri]KAF7897850.1 hypothetical protein EAF01_008816 [Botrytis porri]